jgi:Zn-finger nucleic acid-binding protein
MSDSDTYRLNLMRCPICSYEATHRAVVSAPHTTCPKCQGTSLMDYKYTNHVDGCISTTDIYQQAAR